MTTASIYADREDAKQVEEEEKNKFVWSVLEGIGIPIEEAWPDPLVLTLEQKIELRKFLGKYSISVVDIGDGSLEIFVDDDIVARWYKPKYILKKDLTAKYASNKLYFEIIIHYEDFEEIYKKE